MRLDVCSHHVKVSELDGGRGKDALIQFCKPLIRYRLIKSRGRFHKEADKVFAAATKDRREFRFHVNQLEDLLLHLRNYGYDPDQMEVVYHDHGRSDFPVVEHPVKKMFDPRPNQVKVIDYVLDDGFPQKIVTLPPGAGKALQSDTPVLTPTGWKPIGSIRVDDKVMSIDGDSATVTGVYPQGIVPLYRFITEDGRFVLCCASHLWRVYGALDGGACGVLKTSTIAEVLELGCALWLPVCASRPTYKTVSDIASMSSSPSHYYTSPKGLEAVSFSTEVIEPEVRAALWALGAVMVKGNGWTKFVFGRRLKITGVVEAGTGEAVCISVDHQSRLFITKDHLVTHNTYVAMRCMWLLKIRGLFTFRGGYTKRWIEAFDETFEYEKGDVIAIDGGAGLVKLMKHALDGKPVPKVLIMSFGTWRNYIKDYEESNGKSELYPISPDEFFEKLGIGYRVIDEVHQEFHLNFKIDLYTHVYKSLSLSGTMESSDPFMNKMYCIPYPVQRRNDGGGAKPHIAVKALFYRLSMPKIIRYKGPQGGYSHNAFEESLMSKKGIFPKYLKLIHHVVEKYYGSVREDGQKMLVFCASVNMCTVVQGYLQKMYPTLTVARYCQDDDYQDLLDADIGVSTVLSAGTAVDIPNLRLSLLTTAIDSRQSNEQALGRTRPLKDWPGVTPMFLYFVCEDIDRHVVYHQNKMNFFKGRVLSHEEEMLKLDV